VSLSADWRGRDSRARIARPGPSHLPLSPTTHNPSWTVRRSCKNSIASTGLHPTFRANSVVYFTGRSMCDVCRIFGTMAWCGLLTIWTRYITASPFRIPLKPGWAPDHFDPAASASRKCLRQLGRICGTRAILSTLILTRSPQGVMITYTASRVRTKLRGWIPRTIQNGC